MVVYYFKVNNDVFTNTLLFDYNIILAHETREHSMVNDGPDGYTVYYYNVIIYINSNFCFMTRIY